MLKKVIIMVVISTATVVAVMFATWIHKMQVADMCDSTFKSAIMAQRYGNLQDAKLFWLRAQSECDRTDPGVLTPAGRRVLNQRALIIKYNLVEMR